MKKAEYYRVKAGTGINIQLGAATHVRCRKNLLYVHTYTYIHIYIHTHTHTHTYIGGADKSLTRPGREQATVTEDFDVRISYL